MVQALEPADPQQVGRYRLLGRIGRGGMGQVFLGQSPGGRMVAVKLIRADLAGDSDFRARFAREVTTARTVSGIFTVPVVDADVDGPQPRLVTAFVDGPSLADAVASGGPLPEGPALTLAAGLAEGLEVIHAAGVVHRDLKPSNVLLASDGPHIIDFGISRAADGSGLTRTGWVSGSPGFMSPEQAEGRPAGPASDIFSLGSVLAFAVSGQEPFGSGTAPALLYRVVHGQPDTAALPAWIRPLVERCLAKDPEQRPAASQIVAELGPASAAATSPPSPGWTAYTDPEGFRIGLPPGWALSTRSSSEVTFTGPDAGFVILVCWTTQPRPDALADWRNQATLKARSDPTYQQIAIRRVPYRGWNAADWEFTNMYQGQLTHVLDRGFIVTPGSLGYAIELYGPDTGWSPVRARLWAHLVRTFSPAG